MATANPYVTPRYSWRTPLCADQDWYTEQASMLSSIDDDLFNCSATISAGIVYVETNSAYWDATHQTVSSNSAYWNSTHQTVSANSADWGAATTEVENGSAYWNDAHQAVSSNSAYWDSTHQSVSSHSATYWNSTHQTVSANSADWGSTHETVETNSGDWDSTHETVETNSGDWSANPTDWPHWNDSNIGWDSGWVRAVANQSSHDRLAHGLASEPAFAFLWAKGIMSTGEEIFTCEWDFQAGTHGCRIMEMNSTNVAIHGYENTIYDVDLDGGGTSVIAKEPLYRVLAITAAATFDSGWESLSASNAGTQVTVAHGLGGIPDFYTLEFSNTATGISGRGYHMRGSRGCNGNMPTVVVDYDATNIIFSLSTTQIAYYYDYTNTSRDETAPLGTPMTGWWYKLKAWSWTPSFTSAWTGFDGSNPTVLMKHGLGQIPYFYLLEFSRASDGSNDIVPLMATDSDDQLGAGCGGDYGVHLQWIGHNYATIKYPHMVNGAASYEDSSGTFQNPTGGFLRLKCWI